MSLRSGFLFGLLASAVLLTTTPAFRASLPDPNRGDIEYREQQNSPEILSSVAESSGHAVAIGSVETGPSDALGATTLHIADEVPPASATAAVTTDLLAITDTETDPEAITAAGPALAEIQIPEPDDESVVRYALWPAFSTRKSAEGLARRLHRETQLAIEPWQENHRRYHVTLLCGRDCELDTALAQIEASSGLTPQLQVLP